MINLMEVRMIAPNKRMDSLKEGTKDENPKEKSIDFPEKYFVVVKNQQSIASLMPLPDILRGPQWLF